MTLTKKDGSGTESPDLNARATQDVARLHCEHVFFAEEDVQCCQCGMTLAEIAQTDEERRKTNDKNNDKEACKEDCPEDNEGKEDNDCSKE